MSGVTTPEQRGAQAHARDQLMRARLAKARHADGAMRAARLGHEDRMNHHLLRAERCQQDIDRLEAELHRGARP